VRRVALACLGLTLADGGLCQEIPTFPSAVEMVRLDVSVSRGGMPLKGLEAQDFLVGDAGVRQQVELIAVGGKKVHAVLALDNSSSVAGERLEHLKTAAHALVDVLQPDDSVSLLTFSDRIRLLAAPGGTREGAHRAIDATHAERTTALRDAVFAAVTLADPDRGRPLVLVFSDGQDVGSWLTAEQVLAAAAASELVAHVVVAGRKGEEIGFLQELGSTTGGEVWHSDDQGLKDALLRALDEFRNRYTLQYSLQGEQREGWHAIDVQVKSKAARVRVRKGYLRRGLQP
jgi:VWFA-related protein